MKALVHHDDPDTGAGEPPERGCAVGLILPHANTAMMQLHLDEISTELPAQVHAAMITDGAGWHRAQALRMPANITLIAIPPATPRMQSRRKTLAISQRQFPQPPCVLHL